MQSQDIRKWFMKKHEKDTGNGDTSKLAKPSAPANPNATAQPGNLVQGGQESSSGRKKTSKYFAKEETVKDEMDVDEVSPKKVQRGGTESASNARVPPGKKIHKLENDDEDEDDDFVTPTSRKGSAVPNKKLKTSSGRGVARKIEVDEDEDGEKVNSTSKSGGSGRGRGKKDTSVARTTAKAMDVDEVDEDDDDGKVKSNLKSAGRGRGRGTKGPSVVQTAAKAKDADEIDEADMDDKDDVKPLNPGGRGRGGGRSAPAGGRGRGGGGRGGFANFGERKDPPHKGEKEVPEGADNCLGGLTFVITGTLDSLEREEAEDLIKRYGGRVTGSVSKKTNYLLCDDDVGGRKSEKAMELGTSFLKEDGLFDMIRASNKSKPTTPVKESKKLVDKVAPSPPKKSPQKPEKKLAGNIVVCSDTKELSSASVPPKQKSEPTAEDILPWTEKYRPKLEKDIVGNQSLVKQLRDWLVQWNNQFLNTGKKAKGKKQNDSGDKKAILLCGTPGIGKTSSAKLISKMLGFQTIEVNASDSRGKADAKIEKGIGGSTSNSVKELVSNEALCLNMQRSHHQKTVLIMDEVDGMSAGDRGGVADLIASIKMSKIPIICICNDRYSQKLKSLVNHCLVLNFKKPLKQQISKRLAEISRLEGIQADGNALEELAERVNGDIRMAVNQLQYMSLSMSVIKFDDIKQRLKNSSKDEDISPFTAVDKLFGFNAGRLRMDERVDLCMSDPDLVPLIIQENYINYRPSSGGKDDNEMKRMSFLARAAESIGDGDIVNVQIRRYRQWQLSQTGCLASCIIPAALMHGQRGTFEQGEKNYNRFGGWLGKNSTMGKNYRLLEDLHVHHLASRGSNSGRATLRLDYLTLLLKRLTDPLKTLPKDEAVEKVVEFMDLYSISMEDLDTIMEISKFKGHPNPMEGVQPAVKAALTRAYKKGSSSRVVRAADLITLPGIKKAPKKRVAAMLEPIEDSPMGENVENEEDTPSDAEDQEEDDDDDVDPEKKLESLNSKGIRVQMELKGSGSSSAKKGSGRGKGSSGAATASDTKKAGRGGGAGAKRKR